MADLTNYYTRTAKEAEGCHEVIAESLDVGLHIKCKVKDDWMSKWGDCPTWIVEYVVDAKKPYVDFEGYLWKFAIPVRR